MIPGPVSDAYDPEFSTAENRDTFVQHYKRLHEKIGRIINAPPVNYLEIPHMPAGKLHAGPLCERDWRFIRFAMEHMQTCFGQ